MATLAEAVDAAETDWLVSADIPDSVDYLTVESEVVQVTATFPAQYQARDGSTSAPRIRVVRGAGGTTAASHADGTTLTPLIPPSAGSGGAAALSLDNTIDPPVDITSLVATGATIVGSEATLRGKDFYAQDDDPGAVGAGSVWKDTTTGFIWERNPTDDEWDPRFELVALGAIDVAVTLTRLATASGAGAASAGSVANSVDGSADASSGAGASGEGAASADSLATSVDGNASASISATAVDGNANASQSAFASGAGGALVAAQAITVTGTAQAGSLATRGAISAGMFAEVDGTSARMAFNGITPIAIPELPATPTEQDIADVLVALGLCTQAV